MTTQLNGGRGAYFLSSARSLSVRTVGVGENTAWSDGTAEGADGKNLPEEEEPTSISFVHANTICCRASI